MQIGILQTGHLPDEIQAVRGDYDTLYRALIGDTDFDWRVFNVVDMELPDGPKACDGWLITGSKHGAYEDHPWIAPLEDLIRGIRASGRPLVGICFGHQIIAQALGGRVEKFDGGWSIGRKRYTIEGRTYDLTAWHQDQVTELPEGATLLGSSDFCANAAIAYGDSIFTIQPHPEFDADFVQRLIAARRGAAPEAHLDAAAAALDLPLDNAQMGDRLKSVFTRAAVRA